MSAENTSKFAYVRQMKRLAVASQIASATAAGVGENEIWVEDRAGETWDGLFQTLQSGDLLVVAAMDVLHPHRPGARVRLEQLAEKGVDLHEIEYGHTHCAGCLRSAVRAVDMVDALSQTRHRWTPEAARKAQKASRGHVEKAPRAKAMAIWKNTTDYPTIDDALSHPDMAGWKKGSVTKSIEQGGFGPRGTAVRRKT